MTNGLDSIRIPAPPLPVIDRVTYRLPNNHYVPETVQKTGIVLHHTLSRNVSSVFNHWLSIGRIGTAYVIHSDGTIYEFFPDNCWAWHLGPPNGTLNEMRTIGIELVSEGAVIPHADGTYRSELNIKVLPEHVVDLGYTWRGFRYFDIYDDEQIRSLIQLTYYLCDKYSISRKVLGDLKTFMPEQREFKGIYTHAQVRSDKKDVHPEFPVQRLAKWAKLQIV